MPDRRAVSGPPPFDAPVVPGGYHWWYLDALDPAGREGLVIIAFVGSVFSPYYYRARSRTRSGSALRPEHFSAINVGLYRQDRQRWCMTERRAHSVSRTSHQLIIGNSRVNWHAGLLDFDISERSAPFGQRVRGRVRVRPTIVSDRELLLDEQGRHRWIPWAPLASVEVDFDAPRLSWSGEAYLDSNRGEEPLEAGFDCWDWSRTRNRTGVQVQYDVTRSNGSRSAISLEFRPNGQCMQQEVQPARPLERTKWGIERQPRSPHPMSLLRTLEDTPFYARSLLAANSPEGPSLVVHESLSLERFRRRWVRSLLPFRMPREWAALP